MGPGGEEGALQQKWPRKDQSGRPWALNRRAPGAPLEARPGPCEGCAHSASSPPPPCFPGVSSEAAAHCLAARHASKPCLSSPTTKVSRLLGGEGLCIFIPRKQFCLRTSRLCKGLHNKSS